VERFQGGRTSITDEDHLGCPTISQMADNAEQVGVLIQEDRYISVIDIANKLGHLLQTAYSIIHEDLRYHELCARWVPKQLTDEHKWVCIDMCIQFLQ
jgi:hypothetical protein